MLKSTLACLTLTCALAVTAGAETPADEADPNFHPPKVKQPEQIKAYCLDFNWQGRRGFSKPGGYATADPTATVEWFKKMNANTIQTFCVSSNGWAWYKSDVIPPQPGLKHDFLREVVKLGHAEGMLVMGYFTIGANTRWGRENPELSYGTPSTYHIPYTDEYLKYVDAAITDAVKTTGIDGFMIDWVWQPRRQSTNGKWIDAEKKLYEQLTGEAFPGEDKLTRKQELAYSRKAIDRCWKTIRKAAKTANPNVIIWLTSNSMRHPHVTNSDMYREVDWLMGETGNMEDIERTRGMVGKHTRLITCLAAWNNADPTKVVPMALKAKVGLYGFAKPRNRDGVIPLDRIFDRQVSELTGDNRNIAMLARAYHGKSVYAEWKDGKFVEPDNPPPFNLTLTSRRRGSSDTGRIDHDDKSTVITITTPYQRGRAALKLAGKQWPETLKIRLLSRGDSRSVNAFRVCNGLEALGVALTKDKAPEVLYGKLAMQHLMHIGRPWGDKFAENLKPAPAGELKVSVLKTDKHLEVAIPAPLLKGKDGKAPEHLVFEWDEKKQK